MRLYEVAEKVILEGKIATIVAVDEANSTVDVSVNGKTYKNVPNTLVVAKRLPRLHRDLQLGKIGELNLYNGSYKYKITGYRSRFDYDIEVISTLQKETGLYVDFGVLTGAKLEGVNKNLLGNLCLVDTSKKDNVYAKMTVDGYSLLPTGDNFKYQEVGDYCKGNFTELPYYRDVYISKKDMKHGVRSRKVVRPFVEGASFVDDCLVTSTDAKKTTVKMQSGKLEPFNTRDLFYGGIQRACTEKDYKDGREHYFNMRVMLKNGKFGYIRYVFNDGKYLIQLDNKKFVEETEFYFTDENFHVGDIFYSTGGEAITVVNTAGDAVSFSGQTYLSQSLKDIVSGKVGRKVYDYTGDTFKNRIGQNITITSYEGDSKASIKFDNGVERKNIQMYPVLNGIIFDGDFDYKVSEDAFYCGKFANPEVLDFDESLGKYIIKAGDRYGTTDFIKKLGIKNEVFEKLVLTVNTEKSYLQKCYLSAKVIGGRKDDNLTIQLQNGIRIYNANKDDLEMGVYGVGNHSDALDALEIYKLYTQENGTYAQIVSKFEDICDVLVWSDDKVSFRKDVPLEDVYKGLLSEELKKGTDYVNKLGMRYKVKLIKDGKAYISFDDGKSTAIVDSKTAPSKVFPSYFDGGNIGSITDITFNGLEIVDELLPEFNSYKFTGKCSKCNEIVSGDAITLKGHKCK